MQNRPINEILSCSIDSLTEARYEFHPFVASDGPSIMEHDITVASVAYVLEGTHSLSLPVIICFSMGEL